jgi:hypothetical protein
LGGFAGAGYAGDDPPIAAADVAPRTTSAGGAAETVDPGTDSTMAPRPADLPPEMPTRPTFTTPAVPPIANSADDPAPPVPGETQEIPQVQPDAISGGSVPATVTPSSVDANNYSINEPDLIDGLGNARDFVAEGEVSSPIGFEVRESSCRLKTGEETDGLLIEKVAKGSPAERAGLRSYRGGTQHALQALAIGAGMAFPPAMLLTMVALPMIEYTGAGKSYDMIIGVDGNRISNFIDFQDRLRNIQPGEIVYFNLVRNGKRIQVAVPIPALATSDSN